MEFKIEKDIELEFLISSSSTKHSIQPVTTNNTGSILLYLINL